MTGTRDWLTRERGSRDWRLLPAAICGWAASLAAHAGFAYCMSHDGMLGALPAVLTCMIPLAVLAGLPFPRLPASVRRRITLWHASVTVCAIAAMVCAASAFAAMARPGFSGGRGRRRFRRRHSARHLADRHLRQTVERLPCRRAHHIGHHRRRTANQFGTSAYIRGPA